MATSPIFDPNVPIRESELKGYQADRKILELVTKQIEIFSLLAFSEDPPNDKLLLLLEIVGLEGILKSKGVQPNVVKGKKTINRMIEQCKNIKTELVEAPELITLSDNESALQDNPNEEFALKIINSKSLADEATSKILNKEKTPHPVKRRAVIKPTINTVQSFKPTQVNRPFEPAPSIVSNGQQIGRKGVVDKSNKSPSMLLQSDDRVFAKIKGYPPWPARIVERLPSPTEKYLVFFYGTYDSAQVTRKMLIPVNDKTISLYGKPLRPFRFKGFHKGVEEMMDDIKADNTRTSTAAPVETTTISNYQRSTNNGLTPPKKKKIDLSVKGNSATSPVVSSTTNIISRSGRARVVPKRFKDAYDGDYDDLLCETDSGQGSGDKLKFQRVLPQKRQQILVTRQSFLGRPSPGKTKSRVPTVVLHDIFKKEVHFH